MTSTTTTDPECGVLTAAAKVARVLDLLQSLPMDLPEPIVSSSHLQWDTDEATARRIIAFLGHNDWTVLTYPNQTIAVRYLRDDGRDFDGHSIGVTVVVGGPAIADLAAEVTS